MTSSLINFIQECYNFFNLQSVANEGDFYGLLSVLFLIIISLIPLLQKVEEFPVLEDKETKKILPVEVRGPIWKDRLSSGLSRSRNEIWGKVISIFHSENGLSDEEKEKIEEILYGADIGPGVVGELMESLEKENFKEKDFKSFLFHFLREKMASSQEKLDKDLIQYSPEKKNSLKVIMIVGVNGAGKTTTIGKLATKLTKQGAKVVVGACDTFRAAAVDQLAVWCERANATMVRAKEGARPSGVGFETLELALKEEADYCILDTAGRLHTKENLMEELKKSKSVLKKLDPNAPHQTLLVLDAITGQNAINQAREFHKALDLDGLIFTKCDGSSKAGSAVYIVNELDLPISYIGVGEDVDDLNVFNLDDYLKALLGVDEIDGATQMN